jgi:hypothetical protein
VTVPNVVITGTVRIRWQDLSLYQFGQSVPKGAHVVIDLSGIDELPLKWPLGDTPGRIKARDKFDFLDYQDQSALKEIAATADRIEVDGEGHNPRRIAQMVQFLRAAIAEQEAARDNS